MSISVVRYVGMDYRIITLADISRCIARKSHSAKAIPSNSDYYTKSLQSSRVRAKR